MQDILFISGPVLRNPFNGYCISFQKAGTRGMDSTVKLDEDLKLPAEANFSSAIEYYLSQCSHVEIINTSLHQVSPSSPNYSLRCASFAF